MSDQPHAGALADSLPEERWATGLYCPWSGAEAPLDEPAFLSPVGRPWLVRYELDATRGAALRTALAGRPWTLWRYRELLPLRVVAQRIDLGEGGTPLLRLRRFSGEGVEVLVKDESGNPSRSFKDRGLSLAVNRARELGAPGVQLASAGNAALSLATYAAAAGMPARVALPTVTPGTIERRCRELGAEVHVGGRTLVESAALLAALEGELWSLLTLKEPYRVEGKKTMGLEIAEQLGWATPDWIVYPTGGGTGIVGMDKAFDELRRLGLLAEDARPRFAAVQMEGCAPIVRAFGAGADTASPWERPETDVWGLRVPEAVGDFLILRALRDSGGTAIAVSETAMRAAQEDMARREGLRCGPEGAAALAATRELVQRGVIVPGERVVVLQTGDGANYEP